MDNFLVDYDKRTLQINFEGETFNFNLLNGDVGDYWYSFTTKNGVVKDINFYQESEKEKPSLSIYGVTDGIIEGYLTINTNDCITLSEGKTIGNPKNYFNWRKMIL